MDNGYIDRKRLLNFIEENNDKNDWLVSQYNADWIYSFIESAPAVDVVPRDKIYEKLLQVKKELVAREKWFITGEAIDCLINKISEL